MAQQTAVEWLNQMLILNGIFFDYKLLDQAQQMEKEQIYNAFNEGTFSEMEKIDAEEYYNEIYNKQL